jgi:hypothetical protein
MLGISSVTAATATVARKNVKSIAMVRVTMRTIDMSVDPAGSRGSTSCPGASVSF